MRRPTFDLDALRSFVLGVELNSFARAAERLARSTSAVSAQLKKLEQQSGTALVRKVGRSTMPTEAGELLLSYARRMLELNDAAAEALRANELQGSVRVGLLEDFGENLLPTVLGRFARAHVNVRIEVHVGRNADLRERLLSGRLDLALIWEDGPLPAQAERLGQLPLCWIGPAEADSLSYSPDDPLPLVTFEAPCLVRTFVTAALDRAGIAWRVASTSPSLGGLWAATTAGLGLTVRTRIGLPAGVRALPPGHLGLPALPALGLLLLRADASPATTELANIVREHLRLELDA